LNRRSPEERLGGAGSATLACDLRCRIAPERCASLQQAVERAARLARAGEAVLLSPACASFDMFRDYQERGKVFAAAVHALP